MGVKALSDGWERSSPVRAAAIVSRHPTTPSLASHSLHDSDRSRPRSSPLSSAGPTHLVFVYGTLKRGQANHHWLVGAEALGRTRLQGLAMHNVGPYPMAVPVAAPATESPTTPPPLLHSELYRVDAAGLSRLDLLEDVPNEYQRLGRPLVNGQEVWVRTRAGRQFTAGALR